MRDREIKLNPEIQLEAQKDRQLETVVKEQKFGKILRVYIDVERDRRLIDNFAAYELGLLTYEEASSDKKGYYVITKGLIAALEAIGYKIEYFFWERKLEYNAKYKEPYIDNQKNLVNPNENLIEDIEKFNNLKNNIEKEYLNNVLEDEFDNSDNILKGGFKK